MASIKVAVRVRPLSQREVDMNTHVIVKVEENSVFLTNVKLPTSPIGSPSQDTSLGRERVKQFTYDHSYWSVYPDDPHFTSQQMIYEDLGTCVVDSAYDGYNACVLAYGQTGTGKTYTMMGDKEEEQVGLIPRICQTLLERMEDPKTSYRTEVSYLEIYNERVRDLLRDKPDVKSPGKDIAPNLRVREHPKEGPYVQDLSKHIVVSYKDILDLMDKGNANRTTAATQMNDLSSRSHAIFTIRFTQASFHGDIPSEIHSKIHLVDLAGSERVDQSGASGIRLKEGGSINKSLVTLGTVISTLADLSDKLAASRKNVFIPYRDSVLTWLLKDSLGGNSRTIMIATISPADCNYGETLSTLRYASRAKKIVNKPVVNEDPNVKLIKELQAENQRLRALLDKSGIYQMHLSTIVHEEQDLMDTQEKLSQNEAKVKALTERWADKWTETASILQEHETLALRKAGTGIILDSDLPHLIVIEDSILNTGMVLYHLREGDTHIGRADSEISQDIVLCGLDVQSEHCIVRHDPAGDVFLLPLEGAMCAINNIPVMECIKLCQGALIRLGRGHIFRFNHPAEAAQLRQELKSCSKSMEDLWHEYQWNWSDAGDSDSARGSQSDLSVRSSDELLKIEEKRKELEQLEAEHCLSEAARLATLAEQEVDKMRLKEKEAELRKLRAQNESLTTAIIKARDEITIYTSGLDSKQEEEERRWAELQEAKKAVESAEDKLKSEYSQIEQTKQKLESQTTEIQKEKQEVQSQILNLVTEKAQIENEKNSIQAEKHELAQIKEDAELTSLAPVCTSTPTGAVKAPVVTVDKTIEIEQKEHPSPVKSVEIQTEPDKAIEIQTETKKAIEIQTETKKVIEIQTETKKAIEIQTEPDKESDRPSKVKPACPSQLEAKKSVVRRRLQLEEDRMHALRKQLQEEQELLRGQLGHGSTSPTKFTQDLLTPEDDMEHFFKGEPPSPSPVQGVNLHLQEDDDLSLLLLPGGPELPQITDLKGQGQASSLAHLENHSSTDSSDEYVDALSEFEFGPSVPGVSNMGLNTAISPVNLSRSWSGGDLTPHSWVAPADVVLLKEGDIQGSLDMLSDHVSAMEKRVCMALEQKYTSILSADDQTNEMQTDAAVYLSEIRPLFDQLELYNKLAKLADQDDITAEGDVIPADKITAQLTSHDQTLTTLDNFLTIHEGIHAMVTAMKEQTYLHALDLLTHIQEVMYSLEVEGDMQIRVQKVLQTEVCLQREHLLFKLGEAWDSIIQWTVPPDARKCLEKTRVCMLKVETETKSKDVIGCVLQVMHNMNVIDSKVKAFCDKLMRHCVDPILHKHESQITGLYDDSLHVLKVMENSVISLNHTLSKPVPPEKVFNKLETLVKYLHKCFKGIRLVDRTGGEGSQSLVFLEIIGSLLTKKLFDKLYTECLSNAVPHSSRDWETFNQVVSLCEHFQCTLVSSNLLPSGGITLLDYFNNVNGKFANIKCQELLKQAHKVMTQDLKLLVEIVEERPLGEASSAYEANDGPLYLTPDTQHFVKQCRLSAKAGKLPRCHISVPIQSLACLAYSTLREATKTSADCAVHLCFGVCSMFSLYCDIMPSYHQGALSEQPMLAGVHHNNCMFLANHLQVISQHFRQLISHASMATTKDRDLNLPSVTSRVRQLGNDSFRNHIGIQRQMLVQLLAKAQGFVCVGDDRGKSTREVLDTCLQHMSRVSSHWKEVLPPAAFCKATGVLVQAFLGDIVKSLLSVEDFSVDDCDRLAEILPSISKECIQLFECDYRKSSEVLAYENVPCWLRVKEIGFVFGSSMQDLMDRWASGKGPLALHFTPDEMRHLMAAIFAESPRREKALKEIK